MKTLLVCMVVFCISGCMSPTQKYELKKLDKMASILSSKQYSAQERTGNIINVTGSDTKPGVVYFSGKTIQVSAPLTPLPAYVPPTQKTSLEVVESLGKDAIKAGLIGFGIDRLSRMSGGDTNIFNNTPSSGSEASLNN